MKSTWVVKKVARAMRVVALLRHAARGRRPAACRRRSSRSALTSRLAGRLLDRVERDIAGLRGCRLPSSCAPWRSSGLTQEIDEHGVALLDRPADEGFLRVEVEDVELVDPGRADQQRALEHRVGRRLVLDDLGRRRCWRDRPCPASSRRSRRSRSCEWSAWRSFRSPSPASMSSASIFMPRTRFSPLDWRRSRGRAPDWSG